jgi:hypothetical protein
MFCREPCNKRRTSRKQRLDFLEIRLGQLGDRHLFSFRSQWALFVANAIRGAAPNKLNSTQDGSNGIKLPKGAAGRDIPCARPSVKRTFTHAHAGPSHSRPSGVKGLTSRWHVEAAGGLLPKVLQLVSRLTTPRHVPSKDNGRPPR